MLINGCIDRLRAVVLIQTSLLFSFFGIFGIRKLLSEA